MNAFGVITRNPVTVVTLSRLAFVTQEGLTHSSSSYTQCIFQ